MSPQVKATLEAFSNHFPQYDSDDDFYSGFTKMCYEIDETLENGSIKGRTLVYAGSDKDGNAMVRDFGKIEIKEDGQIIVCDGLPMSVCNEISARGLEIYEEGS